MERFGQMDSSQPCGTGVDLPSGHLRQPRPSHPPGLCVQCPVLSPWRALSIDGPGRPWVTQGGDHCRLLFVQLSGTGESWAQRGGVTGQAWTVQVVAPRLPGSGRTLTRKQSGNSRSLWGPESPL